MAHYANNTFPLVTIMLLATILLVFGMKYYSAARQAQARVTREDAYRELAAAAVAAQSAGASALSMAQSDLSEIKARLAAIEKVLREVE